MLKIRLLIVLVLICPFALLSAGPESGLLWKIEDSNGHTSHLFGTIHSEDARVLEFPDVLMKALSGSDVFAMELVPDLPTLSRLTKMMHYQDGQTLKGVIGPELYASIVGLLA